MSSIWLNSFFNFDTLERRNILFYALGMIFYKFSLETMNVSISGIVLNRLASGNETNANFLKPGVVWTSMQAISLFMQCFGSTLVGPLLKKVQLRKLLSFSVFFFGIVILSVPVLEFSTGQRVNSSNHSPETWGHWNPLILYAVISLAGLFYGIVELIRRVLPCSIVGSNAEKLRKMDSIIHIVYEISGILGAFFSVYWITYFGWSYSLCLMTIGFTFATIAFSLINIEENINDKSNYSKEDSFELDEGEETCGFFTFLKEAVASFFYSIKLGAKLIFSHRALIWLIPAYTLPLVIHRYFENTILSFYSKSVLHDSDLQVILLGGSNFGELLGALLVLIASMKIQSPLVYIRFDAIMLLLVWVLVLNERLIPGSSSLTQAWVLTPIMASISFGWAAGDVSLGAYIQSKLSNKEDRYTSPLSAIMAFLHSTYLITFFLLNISVGYVYDYYKDKDAAAIRQMFIFIAGILFSVCSFVIFSCTFIPHGSCSFFPESDDEILDVKEREDYISIVSEEPIE